MPLTSAHHRYQKPCPRVGQPECTGIVYSASRPLLAARRHCSNLCAGAARRLETTQTARASAMRLLPADLVARLEPELLTAILDAVNAALVHGDRLGYHRGRRAERAARRRSKRVAAFEPAPFVDAVARIEGIVAGSDRASKAFDLQEAKGSVTR
jgi:hypothetical protein